MENTDELIALSKYIREEIVYLQSLQTRRARSVSEALAKKRVERRRKITALSTKHMQIQNILFKKVCVITEANGYPVDRYDLNS